MTSSIFRSSFSVKRSLQVDYQREPDSRSYIIDNPNSFKGFWASHLTFFGLINKAKSVNGKWIRMSNSTLADEPALTTETNEQNFPREIELAFEFSTE